MARYLFWLLAAAATAVGQPVTLYLIPNTHGTASGWLVDFDTERNHVLKDHLAQLDRLESDETYRFAFSDVPNVISLMKFAPERLTELKRALRAKRVEFSNGFFLEPAINLPGGEALVQMGVLGLDWYQRVFGIRPRHCWMIDVVGVHRQMPQIVAGLGLASLFFNRNNPTQVPAFWWVAPDGTRALALVNGTYSEFGGKHSLFGSKAPLADDGFKSIASIIEAKRRSSPSKTILFSLAGSGDYSLPPAREAYPAQFLREWTRRYPQLKIRFSIPSDYVDALLAEVKSGKTTLPEYSGDTAYSCNSFWMNMPEVKMYFRRDEHALSAAEALATAASLNTKFAYPSQTLYDSWINLLMNMDRNTLWGAGAGAVFKDLEHWDAWDRFASVEEQSRTTSGEALRALVGEGSAVTLFNPLNWNRKDPVWVQLPFDRNPVQSKPEFSWEVEGALCGGLLPSEFTREIQRRGYQVPPSPFAVCNIELPSVGVRSFQFKKVAPPRAASRPQFTKVAERIETEYYSAVVDPVGALVSLKTKPSGTELLGGPANVLMIESAAGVTNEPEHFMPPRPQRRRLDSNSDQCKVPSRRGFEDRIPPAMRVDRSQLATTVESTLDFCNGSRAERTIIFYRNFPRIDFQTRLDLRAENVLVTVDFPLAGDPVERSRGIPYGFSAVDPRASSKLNGGAILPSIRWSNYQLAGGDGLALLDRGLTGHELNGRTVTLALVNAVSSYMGRPNEMLRGQSGGRPASDLRFYKEYSYALVPHAGSWQQAEIPRRAWEFNTPPVVLTGTDVVQPESFLETSDNVIVEAMRRLGRHIEVRLVEAKGQAGTARITLRLPHRSAEITNMLGEEPQALKGGPSYEFPIRPQQIVTLRFRAPSAVATPAVVRDWSSLAPNIKRKALETGLPGSTAKEITGQLRR